MPVLLSEAKTAIRERLGEQFAAQWTNPELVRWLNEGIADIARTAEWYELTATIPAVVGTTQYTTTFPYTRVHRCEWLPTGSSQTYPMEWREMNDMDEVWGTWQSSSGTPLYFTIWGAPAVAAPTTITFVSFPAPTTAGNFKLYAYGIPVALVDTTDDAKALQIPEGWQSIVYDYVEYMALRRDRDPRWQEARAMYERNMQTFIRNVESRSDQPGRFTQRPDRSIWRDWDPYSF